jgi:hypothetical protein
MHRLRLRKPTPAMAVAIAALVLALGGTANAAFGPFKGDKVIKKHSLSGNRLKNHTITGTQVNLGALGKVPSAAHADTAGHATSADTANALPALRWVNLTLVNNWADANTAPDARPPAVALDAQGIVHFRGQITCTAAPCTGQFSTLPSGFAPSQTVRVTANQFNEATGQININPDGTLVDFFDPEHVNDLFTRTGLDGITYALG